MHLSELTTRLTSLFRTFVDVVYEDRNENLLLVKDLLGLLASITLFVFTAVVEILLFLLVFRIVYFELRLADVDALASGLVAFSVGFLLVYALRRLFFNRRW